MNLDTIKKVSISATWLALHVAAFLAVVYVAALILLAGYVFTVNRH